MTTHQINASIQIVPVGIDSKDAYALIDKAIGIIRESGLRYTVGPLDTVVEGSYDLIMQTFKKAQEVCLTFPSTELVVTIKIHQHAGKDVYFEDKMDAPADS